MLTLLKKEISSFLSSLIGYIVIIVFLLAVSFYMWLFPSSSTNLNLLDNGYANMDTLFIIAPWVFMFLIPAITMRSFADEKKSGTIELLATKPLSVWQIVFAKYLGGFALVILSLIPTLVYFYSVHELGTPTEGSGNNLNQVASVMDTGATWGSYIGLLFLGGAFVAIGTFTSSITQNQIIAFIGSLFLCGFCYIGFSSIGSFGFLGSVDLFIEQLGIDAHYKSLSRGVIDTRDLLYFASFIVFFMLLTKVSLESRKW